MSDPLRVVIVDDEPPARRKLRMFLDRNPDVRIAGEADDGAEAMNIINREKPDLVFLDIQMPEASGFDVIASLESPLPWIVFVTAYDEHAIRAFDVGALDYLLKPVDLERFERALERVIQQVRLTKRHEFEQRLERAFEKLDPSHRWIERILVQSGDQTRFLNVANIDWIEAEGNYLRFHARQNTHLVRGTMHAFEKKLDPARFARIHRSAIVNLDRIDYITALSHGDQIVKLQSGKQLTLSRRFRQKVLERFQPG
jgi:two-component system LytT family response regulator